MDIQAQQPLTGADNLPSGTLTLANEQEVVRRAGRQAISAFLDGHNCFSVLRASGKVVVFDTRIPIQLAFYALVEHGRYFLFLRGLDVFWLSSPLLSHLTFVTFLARFVCLPASFWNRYASSSIMGSIHLSVCRIAQSNRLYRHFEALSID